MSTFPLPTKSDTDKALQQLRECEKQFQEAVAFHEIECRHGGARLSAAAARLTQATRSYRRALLDPRLPPV